MRKFAAGLKIVAAPILAVVLILAIFFSFQLDMTTGLMNRAFSIMSDSARLQLTTIQTRLESSYELLEIIAQRAIQEDGFGQGRAHLISVMKTIVDGTTFHNIAIAKSNGDAELSNGATTNVADRKYFRDSMAGNRGIQRVEQGRLDNVPRFLLSVPVKQDGKVIGIIFGSFDAKAISDLFTIDVYGGEAFSFTCDRNGKVVTSSSHKYYLKGLEDSFQFFTADTMLGDMTPQQLRKNLINGAPSTFAFHFNATNWYVTYTPMDMADWFIVNVVPQSSVDAANRFINDGAISMVIAILFIGIGFILYTFLHEKRNIRQLETERTLLRESELRTAMLGQLSNEVLFTGNVSRDELIFNPRFQQVFGYAPCCASLSRNGGIRIFNEDRPVWAELVEKLNNHVPSGILELRVLNAHEQPIWQQVDFLFEEHDNHQSNGFIGKLTNIERQKQALQTLKKHAESDPLTGLINRSIMKERTDAFLSQGPYFGLQAFFMIDIDNFKHLNDTLGHQAGDQILKNFAKHLTQLFRTSDLVCRIGGDEFSVFMRNVRTDDHIEKKAAEICKTADACCKDVPGGFSASVGIALVDQDQGVTFDELYAHADQALYRAKSLGKNQYCIYGQY